QVEMSSDEASSAKPYAVTEWARQAVGPLVAAGRCECEHLAQAAGPLTRIDVEAAFLLAVPLVALPADTGGACVLAVSADTDELDEEVERVIGVHVEVKQGMVVSCSAGAETEAPTWAKGPVDSWTTAILEGPPDCLELGGIDARLARALIEGMRTA